MIRRSVISESATASDRYTAAMLEWVEGSAKTWDVTRGQWRQRLEQFGMWLVAGRSHRVICLVAGIWLINAFDLAMTLMAHEAGLLDEENPLGRHLLESGWLWTTMFKVSIVCVSTYPLLRYRHMRVVEMGALVGLMMYALVAFRWEACYEIYMLSSCEDLLPGEINHLLGAPPPA
jgi:hypothetical protein